ncbi:Fc.00g092560.m01.CDS01 [Cosmosporella sp. VM-42]
MPSQRPYFLSSFLAAFRPQGPSLPTSTQHQQPNKHSHSHAQTASATASSSTARATTASQSHSNVAIHPPRGTASANVASSPGAGIPIPASNRRRGSDSSSEGFREVLGADKWYIGGRTPGGEEKFFKMGVIRRVRSNDGLSLDRLSL